MAVTAWCPACDFVIRTPLGELFHGLRCNQETVRYHDCGNFTLTVVPSWG